MALPEVGSGHRSNWADCCRHPSSARARCHWTSRLHLAASAHKAADNRKGLNRSSGRMGMAAGRTDKDRTTTDPSRASIQVPSSRPSKAIQNRIRNQSPNRNLTQNPIRNRIHRSNRNQSLGRSRSLGPVRNRILYRRIPVPRSLQSRSRGSRIHLRMLYCRTRISRQSHQARRSALRQKGNRSNLIANSGMKNWTRNDLSSFLREMSGRQRSR